MKLIFREREDQDLSKRRVKNHTQRLQDEREETVLKNRLNSDIPPYIRGLEASMYEKYIYTVKKRKMFIAAKDFRAKDKNYFGLRQGDIVCSVLEKNGWVLVYFEDKPSKFGFAPKSFLNLIK